MLKDLHEALSSASFVPALLHGVTGSGKTEVYLCLIEATLQRRKTALMLMPEIGLTPRVAEEFRQRLGRDIAILHSGLSDGERFDEWWRIKRGEARVVIGTRSALFAPLENLGLIVVDEEHDPSYKQQESPRYHARDTALVRGKLARALVVLGSATPGIETFHNARSGKYRYLRMMSRVQSRPLPEVTLVDMREEFKASGKPAVLSAALQSPNSPAAGAQRASVGSSKPARLFSQRAVPQLRPEHSVPQLQHLVDVSSFGQSAGLPLLLVRTTSAEALPALLQ